MTIKGKYFVKHLIDRIKIAHLGSVYIHGGEYSGMLSDKISDSAFSKENGTSGSGIDKLFGQAISSEGETAPGFFVFTVEQPLITSRLLKRMADQFLTDTTVPVVPSFHGEKGTPFILPISHAKECMKAGKLSFTDLFNAIEPSASSVSVEDERILINIRTVEDYEIFLTRHKVLLQQDIL